MTFFILENFDLCNGTQFECFFDSGPYILRMFFFDQINPYLHLVVSIIKKNCLKVMSIGMLQMSGFAAPHILLSVSCHSC